MDVYALSKGTEVVRAYGERLYQCVSTFLSMAVVVLLLLLMV